MNREHRTDECEGQAGSKTPVRLRYEGRYDWIADGRSWTIISCFIDADGLNRRGGTLMLEGLRRLGIVGARS